VGSVYPGKSATLLCGVWVGAQLSSRHQKRFWRAKISRPLRTSETNQSSPCPTHTPMLVTKGVSSPTMSFSRIGRSSARAVAKIENCLIYQSRQFTRATRHNDIAQLASSSYRQKTSTRIQSREYATKQRFDSARARADVDERSRLGFYTLTKQQGALKMEPHTAQSLYQDFVAHKSKMDHGTNVLRLVESAC
jgi:hypothetical protein